jgi:lactoylglutathione lyase
MKFLWTTLQVKDIQKSLDFYQGVIGLKLKQRHSAGAEVEMAFLGEGETQVELICNKSALQETSGNGVSVGFQVDSLDETMMTVKLKGISISREIHQPNPHVKFFFVEDPDGYQIQFVELM